MKNMIKTKKKLTIAAMAICMLIVTGGILAKILGISFAGVNYRKERTFNSGNGKYLIISDEDLFVQYQKPVRPKAKSIEIPATVKYKKETYRVVSIGDGAFSKSRKTLKKLTIGQNVIAIGSCAFRNCSKLEAVTIKTIHLRKDTIKSYAFDAINKKAVITVQEEKLDEYKKMLTTKNVGITEKTQKIQGKKMNISDIFKNTAYDPDAEITKIDTAMGLGGTWMIATEAVKEEQYEVGDTIEIDLRTKLDPALFGYWKFKMLDGGERYLTCCGCGRTFDGVIEHENKALVDHLRVPIIGLYGCSGAANFSKTNSQSHFVWDRVYDDAPCSLTFKITLPDGIEYQDDSIEMYHLFVPQAELMGYRWCLGEGNKTEVNGQEITVTFDNIKESIIDSRYKPFIKIQATMTDKAATSNTIKASLTYNFKGEEKTLSFNDVTAIKTEE